MSDQFTASCGNFGWIYASNEPRLQWDNSINADDDGVTEGYYYGAYGVITQVNTVLRKIIYDNLDLGANQIRTMALCYFIQGLTYGNLALVFDKAYIVKEDIKDVEEAKKVPVSEYQEVQAAAIASLEKCITYCDSTTFTLPGSIFNSNDISNIRLKQLCHSFIARYLVLTARNKTENDQTDWNLVLYHTTKGITEDFGSRFDGLPWDGGQWYDINLYYLTLTDWARMDCRYINLMDPEYPKHYPETGKAPKVHTGMTSGKAQSKDKRLESDFQFLSSVNFKPERGYYHFSHYRFKRFDNMLFNGQGGSMIEYREYENTLYLVEATANLNQIQAGVYKLNEVSTPRLNRGGFNPLPVTLTKAELLKVIFYEREIELLGQGFMLGFCDMRRRDLLQYGTPLHFPIPGKELETLGAKYYTFGGVDFADGINTSNGGWDAESK